MLEPQRRWTDIEQMSYKVLCLLGMDTILDMSLQAMRAMAIHICASNTM